MVWVPDSRQAGYLGPNLDPRPDTDDDYDNFLHDVIAGITGLPDDMVRPRWQAEPPNLPDYGVDWAAFGITDIKSLYSPAIIHYDNGPSGGLGYDYLQDHQEETILVTFYGFHAGQYASFLRRGFYIWQNRAALRVNNVGLIDVGAIRKAPELIRQQWWDRVDIDVFLRREVQYHYNVRNLLRSVGTITAEASETLYADFDTDRVILPAEEGGIATDWDDGNTAWDDGGTSWDFITPASAIAWDDGNTAWDDGGTTWEDMSPLVVTNWDSGDTSWKTKP